MPHSSSAKKRMRQNQKVRLRNRAVKTFLKTRLKKLQAAMVTGSTEEARKEFVLTERALDKAARRRVIHPNRAARKKSRMARKLNRLAGQAPQA